MGLFDYAREMGKWMVGSAEAAPAPAPPQFAEPSKTPDGIIKTLDENRKAYKEAELPGAESITEDARKGEVFNSKRHLYEIKQGDTLSDIEQKTGVSVAELIELNPEIKNPDKIKAGNALTLPTSALAQAEEGSRRV